MRKGRRLYIGVAVAVVKPAIRYIDKSHSYRRTRRIRGKRSTPEAIVGWFAAA